MKKIKLDLTKLSVESFTLSPSISGRGTVKGHGTFVGSSCNPMIASCGPQTCGDFYCVIATDNPDCSGATTGTLYADSCDECVTIDTFDSGHKDCPCA